MNRTANAHPAPPLDHAAILAALLAVEGPQGWWPAETPFEVMVGAILTQNAAWSNVERALGRLRALAALDPLAILALDPDRLAEALRPSGYYNLKTRRLRTFCGCFVAAGGLEALAARDTPELRRWLLGIPGVGEETADDILLYAFARPVFVMDAYTRRLFTRLANGAAASDDAWRTTVESALERDVARLNEYHALIVAQGKNRCRSRPRCAPCPLHCPARPDPAGSPAGPA